MTSKTMDSLNRMNRILRAIRSGVPGTEIAKREKLSVTAVYQLAHRRGLKFSKFKIQLPAWGLQ